LVRVWVAAKLYDPLANTNHIWTL